MDGRVRVQPGDRWSCRGCGQVLVFDERAYVPQEQLDACRSQCDWSLVGRRGRAVEDGPAL